MQISKEKYFNILRFYGVALTRTCRRNKLLEMKTTAGACCCCLFYAAFQKTFLFCLFASVQCFINNPTFELFYFLFKDGCLKIEKVFNTKKKDTINSKEIRKE